MSALIRFKSLFIFLLIHFPVLLYSQEYTQTIKGVVLDKSIKTPLAGATVVLLGADQLSPLKGASTDANGAFRISGVPVGKQTLRIQYLGYVTQTKPNITVNSGKEVYLSIEMEEDLVQFKAVEIRAKTDKQKPLNELAVVSARTFSVEETQHFAAAVNDPARMASSFAGVVTPGDGNNIINIRGNASNGLLWRMEGVEIPNPNHFAAVASSGGGISILSAQLLSNSDFMTGAFAAEYGNALSGVFDLRLRKGNAEKREYTFQAGVLGLDAAAEGPFRLGKQKGSYLINYRYSTLSVISKIGVNIGDATTNFQDLSFNIWMPAGKAGVFTLFGMGGLSNQDYLGNADSLSWGDDLFKQYNTRFVAHTGVLGLTHSLILGHNTFLKTVVAAAGTHNFDEGEQFQDNYALRQLWTKKHQQQRYTLSSVLNHKFNARHLLRTGAYANLMHYNLGQSNWNDEQERLIQEIRQNGMTESINAFAQWQFRASEKLTFNTGLHSFHFFLNHKTTLEPRLSAQYAFNPRQSLSLGYGLHSQMQPLGVYFTQAETGNQLVNPNVGLSKSHHLVLSFDQSLPGNLHLKTEMYYQHLYNIPVSRNERNSFSMINQEGDYPAITMVNDGRGRNLGFELTFEKFLSKGLYFLLASSVYDSRYKGSDQQWRDSRFNGQYVNSFVAGKEWNWNKKHKNRSFGLNLKLTQMGGLRETPIDLAASRAQEKTVRDETRAFEEKMPDYFRLDVGVRIKRNYKAMTTTLSLDLQNATNRQNIFGKYYDPNTFETRFSYQAPLIPVLAYKVEF